ncbi:glycosyltransferase [Corallococcus exiguus]|uniref:glycosyltransferase n=1 Tax=Corallococcus exiguus TaxID=83462 RepID=UPI001A8CA366|nr:glycosyltransferase [Corallococcus exiguus]MBN8465636.1 glycosyltransferase [Corallococcus exiguus]
MGEWMSAVEVMPTVCFSVAVQACILGLLFWNQRRGVEARRWSGVLLVAVYSVSALVAFAVVGNALWLAPAVLLSLGVAGPLCVGMKHDSVARPLYFTNRLLGFLLSSFILGRWFLWDFPSSASLARALMFVPWLGIFCLVALQVVYGLLLEAAGFHPVLRRRYVRPTQPLPARREPPFPRVTVHIPCHAEPPAVVIATLDAVSRLRYPAFDVIVVDNNTADPALWKPVEAHCARLGERFRFVHVEALPGAKAGALNLALRLTPSETQLVALLDADFVCEPDFLECLVGFFDDPSIHFVQTPHDYRDWKDRGFLRAAYWEERQGNFLQLPGFSERGFATLIGTTCLIRRDALEAAGGWSRKCLTEDSELAFRLSARGGQGLFIPRTFARGLLPQTFRDLQKQRFRWIAGPIQQFQMHWRALLPGRSPAMSAPHRRAWVFHCLDLASGMVMQVLGMISLLGSVVLVLQGQRVPLPQGMLLLVGAEFASAWGMLWLRSRMLRGSLRDLFAAGVLGASLQQTRRNAVSAAFFSRQPLAWRRTSKFKASSRGWRAALDSTRVELGTGVAMLGLAGVMAGLTDFSRPDLFLLAGIGALMEGWRQLSAPGLALLADAELRREARARPALSPARPEAVAPATAAACRTAEGSSPAASPPP